MDVMMDIFKEATKRKLRFEYKGFVSVEDLWDLRIETLDQIYKGIRKQIKDNEFEESLIDTVNNSTNKELDELYLKTDIIKVIVEEKKTERNMKLLEKERIVQKQKLMSILSMKEDEVLKNKSIEEIQKMLDEM